MRPLPFYLYIVWPVFYNYKDLIAHSKNFDPIWSHLGQGSLELNFVWLLENLNVVCAFLKHVIIYMYNQSYLLKKLFFY